MRVWTMRLGSSPLARGLRPPGGAERGPGRIIPARAGFTSVITLRTGEHAIIPARAGFTLPAVGGRDLKKDHPRSRGVYLIQVAAMALAWGSSPLARGLPACGPGDEAAAGIIPARAGFTNQRRLNSGRSRDHPRSRGVYREFNTRPPRPAGSSPLARGLRGRVLPRQ